MSTITYVLLFMLLFVFIAIVDRLLKYYYAKRAASEGRKEFIIKTIGFLDDLHQFTDKGFFSKITLEQLDKIESLAKFFGIDNEDIKNEIYYIRNQYEKYTNFSEREKD